MVDERILGRVETREELLDRGYVEEDGGLVLRDGGKVISRYVMGEKNFIRVECVSRAMPWGFDFF